MSLLALPLRTNRLTSIFYWEIAGGLNERYWAKG